MNSNKTFSFNRFSLLLHNDILINYKKYLFTILGAFILGFVILYLQMPKENLQYKFNCLQYTNFFILCLFGLGAFVGTAFPELENKIKTTNYLMIPASVFEKFMVQIIIRVVAGFLIFCLIFWVDAHLARWTILTQLKGEVNVPQIYDFHFSMLFERPSNFPPIEMVIKWVISLGIFSLGIFLFSVRVFFNKFAIIKTVISLAAITYITVCIMVLLSHIFYPETKGFTTHIYQYKVTPILNNSEVWIFSVFSLSWIFLLPLGYFKLKEKQL